MVGTITCLQNGTRGYSDNHVCASAGNVQPGSNLERGPLQDAGGYIHTWHGTGQGRAPVVLDRGGP